MHILEQRTMLSILCLLLCSTRLGSQENPLPDLLPSELVERKCHDQSKNKTKVSPDIKYELVEKIGNVKIWREYYSKVGTNVQRLQKQAQQIDLETKLPTVLVLIIQKYAIENRPSLYIYDGPKITYYLLDSSITNSKWARHIIKHGDLIEVKNGLFRHTKTWIYNGKSIETCTYGLNYCLKNLNVGLSWYTGVRISNKTMFGDGDKMETFNGISSNSNGFTLFHSSLMCVDPLTLSMYINEPVDRIALRTLDANHTLLQIE